MDLIVYWRKPRLTGVRLGLVEGMVPCRVWRLSQVCLLIPPHRQNLGTNLRIF